MIFKKVVNYILNFIFPPKCIFCGKLLEINTDRHFCNDCRNGIPYLKNMICCNRCGKPLVSFGDKVLCYNCINETHFYYKQIASVFEYENEPRESILRYKTNPKPLYAKIYAELMFERYLEVYSGEKIDFIVNVPSDKKRIAKKGADHAGLICEEFSKISGIPYYKDCLKKIRKTKKQSTLSYTERQTNLNNSIRVSNPDRVEGKTVLILDDVCTTCASIKECSRELKFCNCKKILALTLCTTPKKRIKKKVEKKKQPI